MYLYMWHSGLKPCLKGQLNVQPLDHFWMIVHVMFCLYKHDSLDFTKKTLIFYYMYLFKHIHMYSTYTRNEHKDNWFNPTMHAILPNFILLGPVLVSQTSDLVIQLSLLVFTLFSDKKSWPINQQNPVYHNTIFF